MQQTFRLANAPTITGTPFAEIVTPAYRFLDVEVAGNRIVRLVEISLDAWADWKTYLADRTDAR